MDNDLAALSEADFTDLRNRVVAEMARREALADIPQQITDLAMQFKAIGGDPANLSLPQYEIMPGPPEDAAEAPAEESVAPEAIELLNALEAGTQEASEQIEDVEPPVDGLDAVEDGDDVVP